MAISASLADVEAAVTNHQQPTRDAADLPVRWGWEGDPVFHADGRQRMHHAQPFGAHMRKPKPVEA